MYVADGLESLPADELGSWDLVRRLLAEMCHISFLGVGLVDADISTSACTST